MLYGVVWKQAQEEGFRLLVAHPETLEGIETAEKAMQDGRDTIADLADIQGEEKLEPLSVVELNHTMLDELEACEMVEIGEMMFVLVTDLDIWSSKPWWPK